MIGLKILPQLHHQKQKLLSVSSMTFVIKVKIPIQVILLSKLIDLNDDE